MAHPNRFDQQFSRQAKGSGIARKSLLSIALVTIFASAITVEDIESLALRPPGGVRVA